MGPWLFHGLSLLALAAFAGGAGLHVRNWLRARPPAARRVRRPGDHRRARLSAFLVDGLLFRRLRLTSPTRWLTHILLAGGFIGLFAIGSLGDMAAAFGLPLGKDDAWFAALNDSFGVALLVGLLLAIGRRLSRSGTPPEGLLDDWLSLGLLAALAVGGFLLEAARYLDDAPAEVPRAAYVGFALARIAEPAGWNWSRAHDWLWWSHALAALALVAYLPFSRLFHMFTAPATLALNAGSEKGEPLHFGVPPAELGDAQPGLYRPPLLTGVQLLELQACVRCGECLGACSSYALRGDERVSLAGMIRERRLLGEGAGPLSGYLRPADSVPAERWERFRDGLFSCTLCGRCEEVCPVGIKTRALAMTLREELATAHCMMPPNLELARVAVAEEGNVFNFPNEDRALWAEFLDDLPEDLLSRDRADVLYFVGCVSSFSPAVQEIPQAFLQVLLKAGLDVALLAGRERCCGFPLIMGGLSGDARDLIDSNLAELKRLGASTVVFNCPSCYYTWKRYYPLDGIRLAHASEVVEELVREGRIVFEGDAEPITYHDPCDLGRGLGVYEAPRLVLRSFAPEDYVELSPSREAALCCGGGGDVEMWDPELVTGVNSLLTDAVGRTGTGLLVQGCPQCKRVTQRGLEASGSKTRTMDIAEFVLEFGTFVDPTAAAAENGGSRPQPAREQREGEPAWPE